MKAKGNDLPNAKLSPDLVRQIRANKEGMTDKKRASLLGVHPNVVFRVRHYESWGWVR